MRRSVDLRKRSHPEPPVGTKMVKIGMKMHEKDAVGQAITRERVLKQIHIRTPSKIHSQRNHRARGRKRPLHSDNLSQVKGKRKIFIPIEPHEKRRKMDKENIAFCMKILLNKIFVSFFVCDCIW